MTVPQRTQSARPSVLSWALLACTLPALAACSVSRLPEVTSRDGGAQGLQAINLQVDEDEKGLRAEFYQHLRDSLRESGIGLQESSKVIGDFAIGSTPANLTIGSSVPTIAATQPMNDRQVYVLADGRNDRPFDKCKATRFRASFVLFSRETGERIYRGEGESVACPDDAAPLEELADKLVQDAIAVIPTTS